MKTFRWKNGARHPKGLKAEVVASVVEQIEARDGGVSAEAVVQYAKPKSSPLHGAFEWSDKAAAHQYRLDQARGLLHSVEVVIDREGREPLSVNAFVVTQSEGGGGVDRAYRSVETALATNREYVIKQALADLRAWQTRYHSLNELADIVAAVDNILAAAQG